MAVEKSYSEMSLDLLEVERKWVTGVGLWPTEQAQRLLKDEWFKDFYDDFMMVFLELYRLKNHKEFWDL